MLSNRIAGYSKPIAWFFASLFYSQFIMAASAVTSYDVTSYEGRRSVAFVANKNNAPFIAVAEQKVAAPQEKKAPKQKFTTGPTQPEMQSYQSVNANNMVDLFSGDFSYNIPLLDVGGYPVNLHYQSGITMDQEASWVGLGWNINPGTISRNMRGLPDDFNGKEKIEKTVSMKDNKTLGITIGGNAELLGTSQASKLKDVKVDSIKGRGTGTLGLSLGVFHNTYKGWGTEVGFNAGINSGSAAKGPLSGGLSITNNSQEGLDVSPSFSVKLSKAEKQGVGSNITIGTNFNSRVGIQALQLTGQLRVQDNDQKKMRYSFGSSASATILSFSQPSFTPTISIPFSSKQIAFTAKVGFEQWAFHPNFYVRGYSAKQTIEDQDKEQALSAYGYLYYHKAKGNVDALLDFNREKDVAYRNTTPHIAMPIYTYDTYSITGEGTGGMFRPYRGDIGYVYDHALSTRSGSDNLSLDYGVGTVLHAGADITTVHATTKNFPWLSDNAIKDVTGFQERDTTFEEVYFKNPSEKTLADQKFYDAIGDDQLVRVNLSPANAKNTEVITAARSLTTFRNGYPSGTVQMPRTVTRPERSKRTQVISYLTAEEAKVVGLDKSIRSYYMNTFPSSTCAVNYDELPRSGNHRESHHLSELTVLNPDGRRYVYGVPVYNLESADVSFSSAEGNTTTGLVEYTGEDASIRNKKPKDNYYNKERMPAYAHSFLLSGILSNDYVDVTGDGITEDDLGDAVKFNYTEVYANDAGKQPYIWRAPYDANKAAYNEGLKTDNRDERGSYSYGSREVWYLNSIESKTMIATFTLETVNPRLDGHGVSGENGGISGAKKLYALKEINLYSKADYLKNGTAAKPVKTVHFDYTYELCPSNPSSADGAGKLTLKKVWFTYNKNNKGAQNPYQFTYHTNNPSYNSRSVDRWGNYKSSQDNPGATGEQLSNADYPYALQKGVKTWDSAKAANNVAAWTLSSIKLPSGGKIDVTYESDDYAYVQDRRAMQMFDIAGFAATAGHTPSNNLYEPRKANNDYRYVFVNVPEQVNSVGEIKDKYLEGVTKLFFRLFVKMPSDRWGSGREYVPCYADIINYGIHGNPADKKIWIQIGAIDGESPLAVAAIQFLRLNLPSKAYPYSEPGDDISIKDAVGMLASVGSNIDNSIKGFGNAARNDNKCNDVKLDKSFVRLNNPYYKKLGGGLRVKRVRIYDNWNSMTGGQQQEATYGTEYNYTAVKDVRGVRTVISSGVATYEPVIGNDENPFRLPIDYVDKVGALAPTDYMYSEEPFGETFFPSPSVGYSNVTVQTIHKDKKSANGLQVTEFYTARDFPVITEFTPLDDKSKKSYNPLINNIFKFNAKHYVTLSQGFKVELNDMHGKLKSQSTYAQSDLEHPIAYTLNYYKLQNDLSSKKRLSNTVASIDSANGVIDPAAQMGKDIEIMIDVREQKSSTVSASVELNIDWAHPVPPIVLGSVIPLPSSEVNRYRSIAVLKIVNRYGILDSVIHFDKGSKVSTRNTLYDGETGEVLLSQTSNEYDDPVYNFNYPAHWAYTGMGPAYKNIAAVFSNVQFRQGKMYYSEGLREYPVERFFESGDELLVSARSTPESDISDVCSPDYYDFKDEKTTARIWALDAGKAKEKHHGIYFIDKNGKPFSGLDATVKIIRSGKRNMSSAPVGSITSMKNPVREENNELRLVFDSTTGVIAAGAAAFKDFWKVDSTEYGKDTTITACRLRDSAKAFLVAKDNYSMAYQGYSDLTIKEEPGVPLFEASSYDFGSGEYEYQRKSWMRFDFSSIPRGAIIKTASLQLSSPPTERPNLNQRTSNAVEIKRVVSWWIKDAANLFPFIRESVMEDYYHERNIGRVDEATKVSLPATTSSSAISIDVKNMAQAMLNDYYNTNRRVVPSIMIRLTDPTGAKSNNDTVWSRRTTMMGNPQNCREGKCGAPNLVIEYYMPCESVVEATATMAMAQEGYAPLFASPALSGSQYYCCDAPKDTFVCKPNINDTAVNPYRWGILGNWRLDKSYVYYDRRKESDPNAGTNIRTDGVIKEFMPYWQFTDSVLYTPQDSSRWVWNTELVHVNRKGFEIENRDPLGRYNSGQYGYNQTLPVAVAQNSKAREMFFEGFEDFDYKTDDCIKCQDIRFTDIGVNGNKVSTESHTGKYSLRIPANQTLSSEFPVGTVYDDTLSSHISFDIDSIPLVNTTVTGKGGGLHTEFKRDADDCTTWRDLPNSNVGVNWYNSSPIPICGLDWFSVKWTGYIQPRYSGVYTFYVKYDDKIKVTINRQVLFNAIDNYIDRGDWNSIKTIPITLTLEAGKPYEIEVENYEIKGSAQAWLYWKSDKQPMEVVPSSQLYRDTTNLAANTVTRDTVWCLKTNNAKPSNITLKRFSPLQGTKVVVSAWVKQETPCVNGSYQNADLELQFNNGASSTFILKPKGNILEGWQRIEDTLTIPLDATKATVRFKSTSGAAVYFDDVRVHPYNSNMKSFVYNPVNIRLMAELDENNHATFYEYDDDGTLIRVKKETERGIKTIRETRSALFKNP